MVEITAPTAVQTCEVMGMTEVEKLIEIYRQLENAGLMVTAGKKSAAELMVSHDVVPVVRCKECKHYDNSEGIFWCHLNSKFYPGGMDWHSFPEDGYCSYGERKDNE